MYSVISFTYCGDVFVHRHLRIFWSIFVYGWSRDRCSNFDAPDVAITLFRGGKEKLFCFVWLVFQSLVLYKLCVVQ